MLYASLPSLPSFPYRGGCYLPEGENTCMQILLPPAVVFGTNTGSSRKYIGPRTKEFFQAIGTEDYDEIYEPPSDFED